jgi:hypothetical protein
MDVAAAVATAVPMAVAVVKVTAEAEAVAVRIPESKQGEKLQLRLWWKKTRKPSLGGKSEL